MQFCWICENGDNNYIIICIWKQTANEDISALFFLQIMQVLLEIPFHAVKTYRGSEGIAAASLSQRYVPQVHIAWRLWRSQSNSGHFGEEINLLSLLGM